MMEETMSGSQEVETVTVEELLEGLEVAQEIIGFIHGMLSDALDERCESLEARVPPRFFRLRKYFSRC